MTATRKLGVERAGKNVYIHVKQGNIEKTKKQEVRL